MRKSLWALFKPAVRARWRLALRYRRDRWLIAVKYVLKGSALRAEILIRPSVIDPASDGRLRVLVVDDLLPDPLFGAGYPRAHEILRSLAAADYAVEHYPMQATAADRDRMDKAFAHKVRFHRGDGAHGLRRLLWLEGRRFDVLIVSRPTPMTAFRRSRWKPPATTKIIYDAEAVLSPRERLRRVLFGIPWTDRKYRKALAAELRLAHDVAAIMAVGDVDADLIRSTLNVPVFVLPHSVQARSAPPPGAGRTDLLFVGRLTGTVDTSPNVDSVVWFVRSVMPELDRLLGTGYRLHIVGRVDAPEIEALTSQRVVLHGVVQDLQSLYDRCRLFVAPTRYAAGIPLKLIEAMSEGLPCVTTPLLAAQLGSDGQILATGDSARTFAEQCERLYRDDAAWQAVQAAGVIYVRRVGSPAEFQSNLAQVITYVMSLREH